MTEIKEKLYHISIDVKPNDPVDIRCGGPQYLGFDFYIQEGEFKGKTTNGILKSFKTWLRKEKLVFQNISIREIKPYKIWTKEMIKEYLGTAQ
jgi:hypothetical protein